VVVRWLACWAEKIKKGGLVAGLVYRYFFPFEDFFNWDFDA